VRRGRETLDGRPPLGSWPIAVEQNNGCGQLVRDGPRYLIRFSEVDVEWFLVGHTGKNLPILLVDYQGNNGDTSWEGHSAGDSTCEERVDGLPQARHPKTSTAATNREL
jgi:hypothetical protein